MEIQIYLLNESLSNLVEVRIEGHFNLKVRGLIIILIFGMFMSISGETLCRDNCQLIGMSLIGLARQVQKNRD